MELKFSQGDEPINDNNNKLQINNKMSGNKKYYRRQS